MSKYRPKPIIVEARQFITRNTEEQQRLADWCTGRLCGMRLESYHRIIQIDTNEGEIEVSFGDFIIRGVDGKFSRCDSDTFVLYYDKVE